MKIADALKNVTRIGIDAAPIIYLVENHPKYAAIVDGVVDYIDRGIISGLTCTLSLTETLILPMRLGDTATEQAFRTLLAGSRNFTMRSIGVTEADRAADLRARYNLKTPDALHIATAIIGGCDAFLTNDYGHKRVTELQVLVIDELEI